MLISLGLMIIFLGMTIITMAKLLGEAWKGSRTHLVQDTVTLIVSLLAFQISSIAFGTYL